MNSGRAFILILLVGIAVIAAITIYTFTDQGTIGPAGPDDAGDATDIDRERPDAVATETVAITGRVISRGNRRPVREAEVDVGGATGTTKRDGRFTIEDVPVGARKLRVTAEGSLPLTDTIEISKAATDLGDLLLPWPTVLTGLVTDAEARPVAGANVRVLERKLYFPGTWWRGPNEDQIRMGIEVLDEGKPVPGLRLATDAEGRYRIEGLSAGSYFVSAAAAGHGTAMKEVVEVPASGEATADIKLGIASAISGKVVDSADATVDGAVILITPWNGAEKVPCGIMEESRSTAGGAFKVDRLVEGVKYLVIARTPNGKIGLMTQIAAPTQDLVVKVGNRFNVHGIVTDKATGEVIKGARLWTVLARGEAGEDGSYRLDGMVKHLFFKYVWVKAEGYADAQIELSFMERLGTEVEKNIQLVKLRPSTLVVTARDTNGAPIAGAAVSAVDWGDDSIIASGTTSEVGEATLKGVFFRGVRVGAKKAGYIQVHLATERSGQQVAYPQEFSWTSVEADQTGEFELRMAATGEVSGTVRDRQGGPLAGVTVGTNAGKLGETDAKGAFKVSGAPVGLRTVLTFVKTGYVSKSHPLEADLRQGIEVEMARGGTVVGQVVDPQGKAVGGVTVSVESEETGNSSNAQTDAKGLFSLTGLEPGEYSLMANRAGFAPTKMAPFALGEAETVEGIRLVLTKGLKVSLKLHHPDGSEVNGTIYLNGPLDGPRGERILRRASRRAGRPLTLQLKPGRYQFLASPSSDVEGAGAAEYEQVINAAGELRVELSSTVLRLLIQPKAPEGARVGSISVRRTEPAEPNVSFWFGASEDGSFRSPPLPMGKYEVGVWYRLGPRSAWTYKELEGLEPGDKVHTPDLTK